MKKRYVLFLIMACWVLFLSSPVLGDTIVLKNSNILKGVVKAESLNLATPYGIIRSEVKNLKAISLVSGRADQYSLLTVDNNIFSGTINEREIKFDLLSGTSTLVDITTVGKILFDYEGQTHLVNTSLFFMKNGDLFSGDLLTETICIKSNGRTFRLNRAELSNLQFFESGELTAEALLNNGTYVTGNILEGCLEISPQSVTDISPSVNEIRKVQFNAQKYVSTQ